MKLLLASFFIFFSMAMQQYPDCKHKKCHNKSWYDSTGYKSKNLRIHVLEIAKALAEKDNQKEDKK